MQVNKMLIPLTIILVVILGGILILNQGMKLPNQTSTTSSPLTQAPSPTQTITTIPTLTTTVQAKPFTIEADDSGFYPSGTVNVNKGDNVKITFMVRASNVYYGGLQIRSSVFDTGRIASGSSISVQFVANNNFNFMSYWPNTYNLKATGNVVVS